jgi:hypothetical protein
LLCRKEGERRYETGQAARDRQDRLKKLNIDVTAPDASAGQDNGGVK